MNGGPRAGAPISYDPIVPPGPLAAARELLLPLDLLLSLPGWLFLPGRKAKEPRVVVLLPGFGFTPRAMAPIGGYLARLGHRVVDWGLGRNDGRVPKLLERLDARTEALAQEAGEPVVAIGWSLGGYLAREAARDRPERFRKVITLASPVVGGPRFTATSAWYARKGYDLDEIERGVAERFEKPLKVPVVALYSKRDGVVAWEACIDRWSPDVRHVEVSSTHTGIGLSPESLRIVAREVEES
jgi:pimeloyl-ACP methyl ester carboxylesterase